MTNVARDHKYGKVSINKNKIPTDEPIFILRAQDRFAETVIRLYAGMIRILQGDSEMYHSILISADQFNRWGKKKNPD